MGSIFLLAGLLASALFVESCSPRARLEERNHELRTADGWVLQARIYQPVNSRPPGLVLVHRKGGRAALWEPLAVRAQQSGYLVVAFDLRGHGASRNPAQPSRSLNEFGPGDWQKAQFDIQAALDALIDAGADPENLFIAGEALGASLALEYAVSNPAIQGLVMISPGLDYGGIDTEGLVEQLARRPTLLVWSESDAHAAASGTDLKAIAPGHIETHTYAGSAHGTDLFATSPQSIGQIVVWLNQMLAGDDPPEKAPPDGAG